MFVRNKSIKTFYLETVASGQIQVHNASSSEKVHPLSSYSKIHRYIYLEPFWTGFACKRCLICAYFSPDLDSEITFSQEKAKLWIEDINLIDGLQSCGLLVYCCDVFISCLDSVLRHPFTAEDPLNKWCNATFLQICSDEEINSSQSLMAWV